MEDDPELEAIRRRKLMELQAQQQREMLAAEEMKARQEAMELQVQAILRRALEPEAKERLARLRMVRPELASTLEQQIVALVQQGTLNRRITDGELKKLLAQITPRERDIRIRRI